MVMNSGEGGIHAAWVMAGVLPMCQYVFSGSFRYFILQTFAQLIYLNTIYNHRMETSILYSSPRDFRDHLTVSFNLIVIINATITTFNHYFMAKAFFRVFVTEKKRVEVENQKNFLLGFSHELRNLINSLAGNVKLASLEEHLSSRVKELLLNAEVYGELLLHLVNNILDTGKVEIGELEINPTPTKIYNSLEKIWSICSELIHQKNLFGTMKISKNIPRTLLIDNYRLTQLFLNLVGNAIKYTEKGSINVIVQWQEDCHQVEERCFQPYPFNNDDDQDEGLFEKSLCFHALDDNFTTLDTSNRKIDTSSLKSPDKSERGILKVTIVDTGCGMNKNQTEQLFQKFAQVTTDPSKKQLGTGLGLFITRQICNRSGGEVRAFSKENEGSCFIFGLPVETINDENEQITDLETMRLEIQNKQLRAMIVDDAPFNHLILGNFFDKLGIRVTDTAVNGLEANEKYLARIKTGDRPEIIAMDIDMPVMNGKEASRKIRELESKEGLNPSFLAIVSRNCTDSEIRECLDKRGLIRADSFIKKPASIDELLRAVGYHFIN